MVIVAFLAFDGVQALDICGPMEVFATANEMSEYAHYEARVLSRNGHRIRATNGLSWDVDGTWADLPDASIMIVPGGDGMHALRTSEVISQLRELSCRAARLASVCTGSYLLAEAGLLDGKRASTHWSKEDDFARTFAETELDRDSLFQVNPGPKPVWTSAGVTAGIDMAIAMVEDDLGPDIASMVAQWLVLGARRCGVEAQRSSTLLAQAAHGGVVARTRAFIRNNPTADLRVERLAARAHMSVRNFSRRFSSECGVSPSRFVRMVRTECARRLLATTDRGIEEVASASGFQNRHALRRALRAFDGES